MTEVLLALALLGLSLWLAPKAGRWVRTLHDRENCRVCQQRRDLHPGAGPGKLRP